jgi:UDP-3-O-acyl-N-acetylglucosamine deacetylase
MWVFTTSGFVSAVYKDGAIQVRARDRKSLQPLVKATGATVVATPLADYPYRISITNEQFADWVNQQALSIDYKNFKSEVADTRGYGFAKPLNQVWSVMHDVEDDAARQRS